MTSRLRLFVSAVGLCIALVAWMKPADACGGFFCQQVPVDQSGEHLLFGIEEDGTVVAHIQIQYQGAAESFAWVLPLPANPEVTVGSDEIFRTLRSVTAPQFGLEWQYEGDCELPQYGGDADSDADTDADSDGDGVTVLQQGPVGPYQTAVLSSNDAAELVGWLGDNEYVIPDVSLPEIQSYVNGGYVFLALRLLKDRSVGDLAPIVVRFPETGPCIPLRLTAIAAMADMPIYAWVLADGRAVSTNFLDVVPNWAAIDWLSGGYNYEDVVRRAVDEATGQAFVTEYAGTSGLLDGAFWWDGRYDVEALRAIDDPIAFVNELIGQGFTGSTQMLELLRRYIPKLPELEVDDQSFYNCLECYADALIGLDFRPDLFADDIQATIVDPLIAAQDMAGRHPYLTRLHTTISPEEMTEDPIFRFNLDLGDVSNVHVAQAMMWCDAGESWGEHPVRLTLPDGQVLWVTPNGDPPSMDEQMPASESASQMAETGAGEVQYDNSDAIAGIIDAKYGPPPGGFPDDGDGDGIPDGGVAGGGCSIVKRGWKPALLLVAVLPLLWRRRFRGRR